MLNRIGIITSNFQEQALKNNASNERIHALSNSGQDTVSFTASPKRCLTLIAELARDIRLTVQPSQSQASIDTIMTLGTKIGPVLRRKIKSNVPKELLAEMAAKFKTPAQFLDQAEAFIRARKMIESINPDSAQGFIGSTENFNRLVQDGLPGLTAAAHSAKLPMLIRQIEKEVPKGAERNIKLAQMLADAYQKAERKHLKQLGLIK